MTNEFACGYAPEPSPLLAPLHLSMLSLSLLLCFIRVHPALPPAFHRSSIFPPRVLPATADVPPVLAPLKTEMEGVIGFASSLLQNQDPRARSRLRRRTAKKKRPKGERLPGHRPLSGKGFDIVLFSFSSCLHTSLALLPREVAQ